MYKNEVNNSKHSCLTFLQQKTDQSNNHFIKMIMMAIKVQKNYEHSNKVFFFVFLTSDVKKNSKLKMHTILWPLYTVRIKLYT